MAGRKFARHPLLRWKILVLLFVLFIVAGFGSFRVYQLTRRQPGLAGTIKLSVPQNALPEDADKSKVSAEVLNIFELPDNIRQTAGGDIIMAAMGLEPSGAQFSQPISFTIKVFATHQFTPKVWLIGQQGTEEVKNLQIAFNQSREELTITGNVSHFSQLTATKTTSDEDWGEFFERGLEEIAYYEQKAQAAETTTERAKLYKEVSDRGVAWSKDGLDRFKDFYGRSSFHEPQNYAEYVKNTQDYYEDLVTNETDPDKRLDIFDEWLQKIDEMQRGQQQAWWDERVSTEVDLGKNWRFLENFFAQSSYITIDLDEVGLGEIRIPNPFPKPQPGKLALLDLDDQIKRIADPSKRLERLKHRLERTHHFSGILAGANFDERIAPQLGYDDLGESSILRDMSISIVNDFRRLIDQETNPERRRQLAKEYLDAVEWLRKQWMSPLYDASKAPDKEMFEWPDSITEILKASPFPTQEPQRPIPSGSSPQAASPSPRPKLECNFDGFLKCRDRFDLQGCIYACPMVAKPCPQGSSPNTECKVTDEACSNDCWNKGTAQGSQCADINHCTFKEIQERLGARPY